MKLNTKTFATKLFFDNLKILKNGQKNNPKNENSPNNPASESTNRKILWTGWSQRIVSESLKNLGRFGKKFPGPTPKRGLFKNIKKAEDESFTLKIKLCESVVEKLTNLCQKYGQTKIKSKTPDKKSNKLLFEIFGRLFLKKYPSTKKEIPKPQSQEIRLKVSPRAKYPTIKVKNKNRDLLFTEKNKIKRAGSRSAKKAPKRLGWGNVPYGLRSWRPSKSTKEIPGVWAENNLSPKTHKPKECWLKNWKIPKILSQNTPNDKTVKIFLISFLKSISVTINNARRDISKILATKYKLFEKLLLKIRLIARESGKENRSKIFDLSIFSLLNIICQVQKAKSKKIIKSDK